MMPVPKQKIWILIADASEAFIYSTKKIGGPMRLVERIEHPESREKREDMITDRPSLGRSPRSGYGAVPFSSDPKEIEADRFARDISEHLEEHALKNHFDRLVIAAPPHFLGQILQHEKPHWKNRRYLKIQKDYVHVPHNDLPHYLEEHVS